MTDTRNRLTEVVRGDSRTHYSYDALGRPIQIDEGGVRLQYDWDSADRLVREVQDSARGYHSIEYRYDALDRRIARTVGGRDETRYVWNKAGQIAEIHYRGEVTRYDYDAAGRLARKTLPGGSSQTYTLDAAGRLTRIEYHDRSGSLTDRLDLAHDAEGHIVRKTLLDTGLKQDSALVAEYDDANRMTRVSVSGKTWSLSYDANGNLIGKTNVADAGDATRYTWDSRNRLIALDAPGLAARFEYDPLGRRIARTVNGETTAYLYDGAQAIGEIRGAQTTTVLSGVTIDEALARYAGSGRLEQLTDHLGSVIRRIGEDGGTRSRTTYSPYGEASTTGDAQGDDTGYTGREDDGTGLYFYRARYYDPVLGRFVSEDPIGVAGGINNYAYVEGNPVNYTDPEGLRSLMPQGSMYRGTGDIAGQIWNANQARNGAIQNYDSLQRRADNLFNPQPRYGQVCRKTTCDLPTPQTVCTASNPSGAPLPPGPVVGAPGVCICIEWGGGWIYN